MSKQEQDALRHSQEATAAYLSEIQLAGGAMTQREQDDFQEGFYRGFLHAMKIKEGAK